jgi:hypothetical protein
LPNTEGFLFGGAMFRNEGDVTALLTPEIEHVQKIFESGTWELF